MSEQQDPLGQLSVQAREKIANLFVDLKGLECYRMAWERLLTREEQESLGGDFEECWNREPKLVCLWMGLRGFSQLRAILELAHNLNLLTAPDYQWLRREIGEPETPESQTTLPEWDAERRELRYRGTRIRKVRGGNVALSISTILDDFQEAGWPARIPSRLDTTLSSQPLHDAVKQLNKGLAEMGVTGNPPSHATKVGAS